MTICIDIGNTTIKIGKTDNGIFSNYTVIKLEDLFSASSLSRLNSLIAPLDDIFVSSVVSSVNAGLTSYLIDSGKKCPFFITSSPLPFKNLYGAGDSTGIDRLCNIAGGRSYAKSAFIVADIGTAVNIEVTDETGNFIGGNIFPGIRLQSQSLYRGTNALPEVSFDTPVNPIGKNTGEAIQSGICLGISGCIEKVYRYYQSQLPDKKIELFLTGGDAKIISHYLEIPHTPIPDLTLKGVFHLGKFQSRF